MGLPLDDWQFWVVTIFALGAGIVLARAVLPRRRKKSTKAELTIGGEAVEKRRR